MTLPSIVDVMDAMASQPLPGMPVAEFVVAPESAADAATLCAVASEHRLRVLVWGGGTHQGFGPRPTADVVVSTERMNSIVEHEPDDMTIVVEPGVTIGQLEKVLADSSQTAMLPETAASAATVGGVVAAGLSAARRLKYGPTRDRILEAEIATGDGRLIRAGGRLVKNVTGYDIPRLACGSLGSLGVLTSLCLKLWPTPPSAVTVRIDDPATAAVHTYRPLAVLEHNDGIDVFIEGTHEETAAQGAALGGTAFAGHAWPAPVDSIHQVIVRVAPRYTADAVRRIRAVGAAALIAAHGVGEIEAGFDTISPGELAALRSWAESTGGALVIRHAPDEMYERLDPWGAAPASVALQRRVKQAFDPIGVMAPGRLPGGI